MEGEGGKRRIRRARKDAASLGVEHINRHGGWGGEAREGGRGGEAREMTAASRHGEREGIFSFDPSIQDWAGLVFNAQGRVFFCNRERDRVSVSAQRGRLVFAAGRALTAWRLLDWSAIVALGPDPASPQRAAAAATPRAPPHPWAPTAGVLVRGCQATGAPARRGASSSCCA